MCVCVCVCVCENHNAWLVAWGLCGCMLARFSTVWLLLSLFCNYSRVKHGDPMGPLLIALACQPTLNEAQEYAAERKQGRTFVVKLGATIATRGMVVRGAALSYDS